MEQRLRQWQKGGSRAGQERESFTVQCDDGRLSVTLDKSILQVLTAVASAVLNKLAITIKYLVGFTEPTVPSRNDFKLENSSREILNVCLTCVTCPQAKHWALASVCSYNFQWGLVSSKLAANIFV